MKIAFRARRASAPFLLALACLGVGCGSDDEPNDCVESTCGGSGDVPNNNGTSVTQAAVVERYAALVSASYAETLKTAKALDAAIDAFIEAPSERTLQDAKDAWLAAREPYGRTEAFRFSQGPIDNDDGNDDIMEGPEPLINSWPLDESYIDYVVDGDGNVVNGGIINSPEEFPEIDAQALSAANAKDSETSIATGYHAIEFLLWGQDLSVDGPGARPYTDYLSGAEGTADNPERRSAYLKAVSRLLVDDLSYVDAAWQAGEDNYRKSFLALPPREALGKVLLGMGSLAGGELSHERMEVAYVNKDQEDEHSCFSDNTLADLRANATSIQNVLLGSYGKVNGPGVIDLVQAKDPQLAQDLRTHIQDALDHINAVEVPFDVAIMGAEDSADYEHIGAAIDALSAFTDSLVAAAKAINIDLKFDE